MEASGGGEGEEAGEMVMELEVLEVVEAVEGDIGMEGVYLDHRVVVI